MPTTTQIKTSSAMSGSRRKSVADPLIRPVSRALIDFYNPKCHPGGAITPGAIDSSKVFNDLSRSITAAPANSGFSINADGSLHVPAGLGSNFRIGPVGDFNMAPSPYQALSIVWAKLPATGYSTTNYLSLLQIATGNANTAQMLIDMGPGGLTPRAVVGYGTGNANASAGAITPGAVHQIAHFIDLANHIVKLYVDGVVVATGTGGSIPNAFQDASTAYFSLVSGVLCDVYAIEHVNISASIAAEQAAGVAASAILTADQHVAKDYLFRTGADPLAPRTAYA